MQIIRNPLADRHARYGESHRAVVSQEHSLRAELLLKRCPLHAETPLREFDVLAARLGVSRVLVKDESARLGLSSFKALGGAYAVMLRSPNSPLRRASVGPERPTFATATDGNHGISVAAGAWIAGCAAVCFLPKHVERAYEDTMRLLGAQVIRVDGTYDVAVAHAASAARQNGWTLVSDTTEEVFDAVTRDVLAGYGVMVNECAGQLARIGHLYGREALTHVFVQGGVGGLAAAFAGGLWQLLDDMRPTFVIVEPESADCLFQTALHGEMHGASGNLETCMGMLSCGRPSRMAWTILSTAAEYFMTIAESGAAEGMAAYASEPATRGQTTTPSGAAGLSGLIEAASSASARTQLGLTDRSVVLAVCTETHPTHAPMGKLMTLRKQVVHA